MGNATEATEVKTRPAIRKPNNAITVAVSSEVDFFKQWCIFLRPLVNLTNREIDVIAHFLSHRLELSKSISDPAILNTMLMGETTRNKIIQECSLSQQHFYVIMSNLRKNKVIVKDVINPRLIPNIREDDNGCFQLSILFKQNAGKA